MLALADEFELRLGVASEDFPVSSENLTFRIFFGRSSLHGGIISLYAGTLKWIKCRLWDLITKSRN